MPQLDLATLHEAVAAAVPDRECLIWRDRRLTWRDVTDRTRRLARVLHEHGLGVRDAAAEPWESPHDHLALYLHNCPEYLEGLLGAHKARVAPFNVNYRYVDDELAQIFGDARPRAILFHATFAGTIGRVAERLDPAPLLIQVADDSGNDLLPGALDYEKALAAASPEPLDGVVPDAGDLHILYTGGTTGLPKGVLWRIGDLMLGPLGLRDREHRPITDLETAVARAVRSDARVLVGPPMMHGAGTWSALGGWLGGACVILPARGDGLDADDLLATAARERATRMPLVGDAFARPLADAVERGAYDLSAMRSMVNSAAAIDPGVAARLLAGMPNARGIVDVLGSSESGFSVTRRGNDTGPFVPQPDSAVLSADRTRRLEPGEDEMGWLAKGGSIPLGYLNDRERTTATFITLDGVRMVVPGDRAKLLADGTVEVHGRESTTINTGGEKVFAEEVEAVLRAVPGVTDALVLGRPSERWGTEIVAVLGPAAAPSDEDLRAACAERLARYKIPKAFVRTDGSLRLPNGKADYAAARALVTAA
ncbi:AMP-binding protein [Actinomadura sp. 21ATH]|uniref:AMP-binding protein n=1 Tax=Actinomadura sp. 21ATH TaxID=1735444 RepID=UPI0035BF9F0C